MIPYKHNLLEYYGVNGSRGSSVSIVTSPGACPSGARSPTPEVQAGFRAHRTPCTAVPRAVPQGLSNRGVRLTNPFSPRIKNEWGCTSTPNMLSWRAQLATFTDTRNMTLPSLSDHKCLKDRNYEYLLHLISIYRYL